MRDRVRPVAKSAAFAFAALAGLALLTLGELALLHRRLFADPSEYGFVLESVRGVLAGTPVSKSWAHRVLAPSLVHAIEPLAGAPFAALRVFTDGMVCAANLLLFVLLRKSGVDVGRSLAVCAAYVVARVLVTYRLEYPWDEVDVVLFMVFAYAVPRERPWRTSAALLLLGLFNHETALLFPLWLLLAPSERPEPGTARRELAVGAPLFLSMGALIVLVRDARYRGKPELTDQVFEKATPVVENHLHVGHNLHQVFVADWTHGRAFDAAAFLLVTLVMMGQIWRAKYVRASWWTLAFLATVVAFGYVNETRHYLPLLSFWAVYAVAGRRKATLAPLAA